MSIVILPLPCNEILIEKSILFSLSHPPTTIAKLPRELKSGVPVSDDNGNVYGNSVNAAQEGIAQVTLSRIFMACPGELTLCTQVIANFI